LRRYLRPDATGGAWGPDNFLERFRKFVQIHVHTVLRPEASEKGVAS
jgi:hypothetical protein